MESMEEKLERESGFLWSNVEEGKMPAIDFIPGGNPELPPLIGKTKYVVNTTKKFRGRIGVHEGVNKKNGKIIVEVLPWQQLREFNAEDLMKNPDENKQQRARDLEKRCGPRKRKSRCEIPKVKWPKRNPKKKKGWKLTTRAHRRSEERQSWKEHQRNVRREEKVNFSTNDGISTDTITIEVNEIWIRKMCCYVFEILSNEVYMYPSKLQLRSDFQLTVKSFVHIQSVNVTQIIYLRKGV